MRNLETDEVFFAKTKEDLVITNALGKALPSSICEKYPQLRFLLVIVPVPAGTEIEIRFESTGSVTNMSVIMGNKPIIKPTIHKDTGR